MKIQLNEALRDAAGLMERGEYALAADAYAAIAEADPEQGALCASQIGAAKFFLGEYQQAIEWYRKAERLGFPADMTADNIREAEEAMRSEPVGETPFAAIDHGPLVRRALQEGKAKRILVPPLPPKKERNARNALPPGVREAEILGLVDMTVFGSAKSGIAFTPAEIVTFDEDKTWSCAWTDVLGVDGFTGFLEDTIQLRLASGEHRLYAGTAGADVLAFLSRVVAARGVSSGGSAMLRHTEAQGRELGDIAHADDERISAHLDRAFGPDGNVWHELISDNVHIDIHMREPTREYPYRLLVTSGLSARPMTAAPEEHQRYAELCLALPVDWPIDADSFGDERNYWPIRLLKTLARLPHEYNTWLGWGHSIPNGERALPYAQDVPYTGAVLIPPLELGTNLSPVEGTPPIQIYQVLPVTQREMAIKLDLGVVEMIEVLQRECPERFGPIARRPRVLR